MATAKTAPSGAYATPPSGGPGEPGVIWPRSCVAWEDAAQPADRTSHILTMPQPSSWEKERKEEDVGQGERENTLPVMEGKHRSVAREEEST